MDSKYSTFVAMRTPTIKETELAHHGIKGMRWGVRRYQNPDGSLTDEGRNRYGYDKKQANKDFNKVKKAKYVTARDRFASSTLVGESNGKTRALARTKTVKQIYKENAEELRALRSEANNARGKWAEIFDRELSKGKYKDEAREIANKETGDAYDKAMTAYSDKCKKLAKEAFGDLSSMPISKANAFGSYDTVEKSMKDALDYLGNFRASSMFYKD